MHTTRGTALRIPRPYCVTGPPRLRVSDPSARIFVGPGTPLVIATAFSVVRPSYFAAPFALQWLTSLVTTFPTSVLRETHTSLPNQPWGKRGAPIFASSPITVPVDARVAFITYHSSSACT